MNTLLLEAHNGVLHITLNRPQHRNAMSMQMVSELRAVLADVARDEQLRALVISGAGGHFCAGGDVLGEYLFMLFALSSLSFSLSLSLYLSLCLSASLIQCTL